MAARSIASSRVWTAAAIRSPTTWRSVSSSSLNGRWAIRPTWSTPTTASSLNSGTPSITLMPFSHKIGFATVVAVDAIQPRGLLRCGDATSETGAQWNPYPLADLFLDARRRSGDEFLGVGVEEQHRGGVNVEHVAHSRQQFGEELVDVKARQGSASKRLELLQMRLDPVLAPTRELPLTHTHRLPDG